MNKHIVKVVAAGVGAAFVLTACAVSNRQVLTGPNGLVVEPINSVTINKQVAPIQQPAEERTTLPLPAQEQVSQPSSAPQQTTKETSKAAPAVDAAKSVEQTKAPAKSTSYASYAGCNGYGSDD